MLQSLETPNDGLDTGAHLLVLLHQRRPLTRERLMPLPEGTIFVFELVDGGDQSIDACLELPEFLLELSSCCIAHGIATIEPPSSGGQCRPASVPEGLGGTALQA